MLEDLSGSKFGELIVIKEVDPFIKPSGQKCRRYFCICSCGKTTIVRQSNLLTGHSKSCGCSRKLGRPKMPMDDINVCNYHPLTVDCAKHECESCGWNPHNKALIEERINKIKRKVVMEIDESDESQPETADS